MTYSRLITKRVPRRKPQYLFRGYGCERGRTSEYVQKVPRSGLAFVGAARRVSVRRPDRNDGRQRLGRRTVQPRLMEVREAQILRELKTVGGYSGDHNRPLIG